MAREVSVIDLISEDRGDLTIDKFISTLPKGERKDAAVQLMAKLQTELSTSLMEQKLTEVKMKKLNDKIRVTEPMKALKQMKGEVKKLKKDTEKLALVLLGCRKMAKAMGIDMPNIKLLEE